MGLPFLRPMDIDPSGPSGRARRASFLSSSVAPFTPFGPSLFAKGGQLGWRSNKHMLTDRCSWVDGRNIGVNDDRLNWDDGWNIKQTVTRLMGWRFRKNEVVRCTGFWQAAQKHLWRTTRVVFRLVFISDQSVASSSLHFSYKNHYPFSHLSTFRRKHIVRASPSSLSEIRPSNSCIIRSHPLTLFLGK